MVLFGRRGFVFCGVAMLASWGGLRLHAAPSIDTDGFLALSKKLLQREDLDPDAAASFLQGFLAIGYGEALQALSDGQTNPELEERMLVAWYTGLSPDPSNPEAVTYGSALVWQVMQYTKAPGFCAVEDWSEAPAL